MSKARYPKTPRETYNELSDVQEGGSLYTLKRTEPLNVEYLERVSRTSPDSPELSKDKLTVYLTSTRGIEYRIVVDCEDDEVRFENIRDGRWVTNTKVLSGFRYRSPNHPKNGMNWKYDGN